MEFVTKGLVLCLIALAGVYQAQATVATLSRTKPTGTVYVGDAVEFTCAVATASYIFKKGGTAAGSLTDSSRYTVSGTSPLLKFTATAADTVDVAGGWTCEGTSGTTATPKVALDVKAATTTSTTMKPTTAGSGSGSGSGGIIGLPLAVMIFAVLVSFFLRH